MNLEIIKDLEYKSFGKITVISEQHYFKGTVCKCWCECGKFFSIDKDRLLSGAITHCPSTKHKDRRTKNKQLKPKTLARVRSRYQALKHGCKVTKRIVSLTLEDYIELSEIKECHYCSGTIDWYSKSSAYFLDRKDNNIDYTKDNCVVCCTRCNMAKGSRFTYGEWLEIGKLIRSWKKED